MKKIFFIFTLFLMVFNLNAIILPEGSEAKVKDVKTSDSGKIIEAYLANPTKINTPLGKIEAKGVVHFNKDGKVTDFVPNESGSYKSPIGEILYKEGAVISFYTSESPKEIYLAEDCNIVYSGLKLNVSEKITFYDGWKPYQIILSTEKKIRMPCGEFCMPEKEQVTFYSSGQLYSFQLKEPSRIKTSLGEFTAYDFIEMSKSGYPIFTKVHSTEETDGITTPFGKICPPENTEIGFYSTGEIKNLVTNEVTLIQLGGQNFYAKAGTTLGFSKKGSVIMATVSGKKIRFMGWKIDTDADEYTFIIYPKNRIYIHAMLIKSIDGYAKDFHDDIVMDKENLYILDTNYGELDIFNKTHGDYMYTYNKVHHLTIYTEDGKIDFSNPPLLFNEEGNIIGYKSATEEEEYDDYKEKWINKRYFKKEFFREPIEIK